MSVILILGAQWGDEGKGKLVDALSQKTDIVARFQGGGNAGHTISHQGKEYIFHYIPCGILHPHVRCYIGNGLVIDPDELFKEILSLKDNNIPITDRLFISGNAHIIMPYHKIIDGLNNNDPQGQNIGTTGRGIGPAYADKANRIGIRFLDLLRPEILKSKVSLNLKQKAHLLTAQLTNQEFSLDSLTQNCFNLCQKFSTKVRDISLMLEADLKANKNIILEGAQGCLLSIDWGTYPFVTSSNTEAGAASNGLGIPPQKINDIIGVFKAYQTRVGEGPFPTQQKNKIGQKLQQEGKEFGATTGRPRRCGWFDTVLARYAMRINGYSSVALTKLDVLSQFDEIHICTDYKINGMTVHNPEFATDIEILKLAKPVYKTLPGWKKPIGHIRKFNHLPPPAKKYVKEIERHIGRPISIISTGADRSQIIQK